MSAGPYSRAAAALTRRRTRAVEAWRDAADAIGPIEPGLSLFLITRGQFSMLDMVQHVIAEIGPCEVSIWTWAIADYEVEAIGGLLAQSRIRRATLVLDRSAEHRNAAIVDQWRARFGADTVRICKNHAKIARVWNDRARVLLRGSMNLNFNPRFEQADITEGGDDFDLVAQLEAELPILPALCSNDDAERASKLTGLFETDTLAMFGEVKTWAK